MEDVKNELEFLTSLIKAIAAEFGNKCEVTLHDLKKNYSSTIVAIENGFITGRKVGDCGSNLGLEVLRGTEKDGDRYNYITQTKDGNILRSSTVYIKNNERRPIGAICINFDISDFIAAENTIKSVTMHNFKNTTEEVFVNNVNELLDYLLHECQNDIGKPVSHMLKEDKIRAIRFLDEKGAFLITKAGNKICHFLNISKFTLYNYLDESRLKKR